MKERQSNRSQSVLGIGCILLGVSLVWVLAFPVSQNSTDSLEASVESLALVISRLDARIESLSNSLDSDSSFGVNPIVRSSNLEPVLRELISQLSGLEAALENVAGSTASSATLPVVGSGASLPNITERYPRNETALGLLKENSKVNNSIGFLGLSFRQVLSIFGSPNQTTFSGGGVMFYYEDIPGEGYVEIGFRNERVVYVETDWAD